MPPKKTAPKTTATGQRSPGPTAGRAAAGPRSPGPSGQRSPGPTTRAMVGSSSAKAGTRSSAQATPSKLNVKTGAPGPSKVPKSAGSAGPSPSKLSRAGSKRAVEEQAGIRTSGEGTQGDELMARKFARSSPQAAPGQSNDWTAPGEPDPWKGLKSFHGGKISENEEYLKTRKLLDAPPEESDTHAVITLESIQNMASKGFSSTEELYDDAVGPEGKPAKQVLIARNADLLNLELTPFMRANLVVLDVAGNQLDNLASLGPCWLRALNGTGNQLARMPELGMMSKLVSINFSFNDMSATNFAKYDFGPSAGRIREVILDGCSISEISSGGSSPFQQLGELQVLSLAHNMISDIRQLAFLESFGTLTNISFLDNPVNDDPSYPPFMLKLGQKLSSLKLIDKRDVKASSFKGWNDVDLITEGVKRSTILNASDDKSSCSCIEGNPCLQPESCNNWKERYEIARQAREAKFWSKNRNFCDL